MTEGPPQKFELALVFFIAFVTAGLLSGLGAKLQQWKENRRRERERAAEDFRQVIAVKYQNDRPAY